MPASSTRRTPATPTSPPPTAGPASAWCTPRSRTGCGDTITPAITAAAAAAAPAGWHTGVTGLGQLEAGGSSKGVSALTETTLGGIGALAVLAFVFASFIAVVPLLMAMVAIPSTFLIVGGLTHLTSVSIIVEFLIALIGLGVAIDYSLLVVTRWREERAHGYDNHEAVARAMSSAGRAVVFSGLTVGISLLALVVLPVTFLATIGVAGFLIPIVSVAVALTLLPALLASVGPWLDRPRLRHEVHASRPWTAWARLVLRRRKTAALIGGAILVALVIPVFALNLGEPRSSALAQSGSAHATLAGLEAGGVPSGILEPIDVLVQADAAPGWRPTWPRSRASTRPWPRTAPTFTGAAPPWSRSCPPPNRPPPAGGATIAAVRSAASHLPGCDRRRRDRPGAGGLRPRRVRVVPAHAGAHRDRHPAPPDPGLPVGGAGGQGRAVQPALRGCRLRRHGPGLAGGTRQPGAVVHPRHRVDHRVGADHGVRLPVRAVDGLRGVHPLPHPGGVRPHRVRPTGAVVVGIGRTGRLVTSAAMILFLAFLSLSTAPMTDLKVMATGLGAGILLDALVIRSLLVPSLVGVLGKWNWYLPSWLAKALFVREPAPGAASRASPLRPSTGAVRPIEPVLVGAGSTG